MTAWASAREALVRRGVRFGPFSEVLREGADPAEAMRLHNEVSELTTQLSEAEERWCRLQEEVEQEG